jgi:hypothetical protein
MPSQGNSGASNPARSAPNKGSKVITKDDVERMGELLPPDLFDKVMRSMPWLRFVDPLRIEHAANTGRRERESFEKTMANQPKTKKK